MNQVRTVKEDLQPTFWSAKRVAIMAIFIALSYVGSLIKSQAPWVQLAWILPLAFLQPWPLAPGKDVSLLPSDISLLQQLWVSR